MNILVNKSFKTVLIFLGLAVLLPHHVAGQQWSASIRPAINFPVEDVSQTELRVGNGLEFTAQYQLMPHIQLFTGFSWHQFDTDEDFDAVNTDYALRGFILGSRIKLPLNKSKLGYFVVVAATLHRIDIEGGMPRLTIRSSFQPDLTFGAGVEIPTFSQLKIVPEVRYASFSEDFSNPQIDDTIALRFVSLSVGIRYVFK
ncbi:MAG: hypothetical protein ABNH00_00360 [Dokdonia sp.]|jgi:opacity protein-like surface antigen